MCTQDKLPIMGSYDCHQNCMHRFMWTVLVGANTIIYGLFLAYFYWSSDVVLYFPIGITFLLWTILTTLLLQHGVVHNVPSMMIPWIVLLGVEGSVSFTLTLIFLKYFMDYVPTTHVSSDTHYGTLRQDSAKTLQIQNYKLNITKPLYKLIACFVVTLLLLIILLYSIGLFLHVRKRKSLSLREVHQTT